MTRRLLAIIVCITIYSVIIAVVIWMHNNPYNAPSSSPKEYLMHGPVSIKSAEKFRLFIQTKGKGDKVYMHIESFGGLIISMQKILHHMKRTEAKIYCITDSHAASAGAMILMQCHRILIAPEAKIVFHVAQMCSETNFFGSCIKYKPVSNESHPDAYAESIRFLTPIKHLLTKKEWSAMIKGKDIMIYGKDMMKRLHQGGVK